MNVRNYIGTLKQLRLWDDLWRYWAMDDNTGVTTTDAMGVANGTITNGSWVTGKHNYAVQVSGGTAYIDYGTGSNKTANDPWTINAWVNPASGGDNYLTVLSNLNASSQTTMDFYLLKSSGWMYFVIQNGGAADRCAVQARNTAYSGNTGWQMVSTTYNGDKDANNVKHYLNGSSQETTIAYDTLTSDLSGLSNTLYTNRRNATIYQGGQIDALGIWSRVLTPDEITQLYNAGAGIFYS